MTDAVGIAFNSNTTAYGGCDIAVFINTKYSFKAPLPLGERVWGEGGVPHDNEKSYIARSNRASILRLTLDKQFFVNLLTGNQFDV